MKRLDVSVLPDGFLVELDQSNRKVDRWNAKPALDSFDNQLRDHSFITDKIRPALDRWHFNDGSMVLPDGLVVEFKFRNDGDDEKYIGFIYTTDSHECWINDGDDRKTGLFNFNSDFNDVIAIKILGVRAEYREHGEQLGMTVVEL